jgi:hypothetical protein
MGLKLKVLASSAGQASFAVVPKIVYRAITVLEAGDPNASPLWTCPHEHGTPLEAVACGRRWLEELGMDRAGPPGYAPDHSTAGDGV